MQDHKNLARLVAPQNQKIAVQNQQLVDLKVLIQQVACENQDLQINRDEMHNMIVLLKEENQRLKDEVAILKGQKPRPKIPPSALEGAQSKDKQNNKNKFSREEHPWALRSATDQLHFAAVPQIRGKNA